jgi:imidazolonepropionase-like amidohydrolase
MGREPCKPTELLMRRPALPLLLQGLLLLAITAPATQAGGLALLGCHVFDGVRDAILKDRTVLLREGRIERMLDGENAPQGYEAVSCENHYLMPGLIDVHTHLDNPAAMQRALASGVTTVRSAGVSAFQDIGLREMVRAGALPGPDVVAAGVYVTPDLEDSIMADPRLAEWHEGVNSEQALRAVVRVNAERGVDVIKTRGTERAGRADTDPRQQVYSRRELAVVVEEASRHGLAVMVHAHGDEGARAAVEAGARSIEHGSYLSEDTLRMMRERGTWFVPTLITMLEMNEEQYHHVLRLRGAHMVPQLEQAIRNAHRLGVKIATGADNYYDEQSINRVSLEVMHLHRLGLSPFEALQAATVSSAELLGLADRTGRIAPGYEADLILVPGNPLEDVRVLQDPLMVISNGRVALQRIPFGLD